MADEWRRAALKQVLEEIWRDAKVRAPGHCVWWHVENWGYTAGPTLHYSRGKKYPLPQLPRQKIYD